MSGMWSPSEVAFVTTTYEEDVHYCRALLASLRHFYPDHEIIVIVDGQLRADELPDWPGVRALRSADVARHIGLPLTGYLSKLALFWWDDFDAYAYFDADSILTTALFDRSLLAEPADIFLLGGSWVDLTDPAARARFAVSSLDVDRVRDELDSDFVCEQALSVMTGNFVVRPHDELTAVLRANVAHTSRRWESGPVLHHNDQSLLTYAVNKLLQNEAITVRAGDHLLLPRPEDESAWPDLTVDNVIAGSVEHPYVIHWSRPCRIGEFTDHAFGAVLAHFEREYYAATPNQSVERHRRRRIRRDLTRRARRRIRPRSRRRTPTA